MSKNPAAVALGKASWRKRKKNPKHKEQLSKAGRLGAAKTNAIKAAKRATALDGTPRDVVAYRAVD